MFEGDVEVGNVLCPIWHIQHYDRRTFACVAVW